MTSYSDALRIIRESAQRVLPAETVPLVLSHGRVLSRPIVAGGDIPADANSAMDGYAVRAEDLATAGTESPVELRVIGEAAAGSLFQGRLGQGDAVRIMTGGVIPDGANAVIEIESTSESDGMVAVRRPVSRGESIRKAGEDVRAGMEVIAEGKRITPGDIGVLATLGVTNVPVRVKPKVAILSTGNEIVEAFRTPATGEVRNSTAPALYAYCQDSGGEPIDLGIARDNRDEIESSLENGLRFDILLTTGGVSAGSYDFVQHILPQMGVDVKFHRVNIKPGKPLLFGTYGKGASQTLVFALPGNPVSSLVTFRQFVLPVIRQMLGEAPSMFTLRAALAETITKSDGKRHFIRGILTNNIDGSLQVSTTGTQSSGAMSSMSRANCLIVIEEEVMGIEAGQMVTVEMLGRYEV